MVDQLLAFFEFLAEVVHELGRFLAAVLFQFPAQHFSGDVVLPDSLEFLVVFLEIESQQLERDVGVRVSAHPPLVFHARLASAERLADFLANAFRALRQFDEGIGLALAHLHAAVQGWHELVVHAADGDHVLVARVLVQVIPAQSDVRLLVDADGNDSRHGLVQLRKEHVADLRHARKDARRLCSPVRRAELVQGDLSARLERDAEHAVVLALEVKNRFLGVQSQRDVGGNVELHRPSPRVLEGNSPRGSAFQVGYENIGLGAVFLEVFHLFHDHLRPQVDFLGAGHDSRQRVVWFLLLDAVRDALQIPSREHQPAPHDSIGFLEAADVEFLQLELLDDAVVIVDEFRTPRVDRNVRHSGSVEARIE